MGKTEFSIEKRFKEHCSDAYKRQYEQRPLYAAMRKYGIEHFHISLLEETNNPEERECFWIEKKQSFKNGYNATLGGDGKKYIDYELVCEVYKQTKNKAETAKIVGCSPDSATLILKKNDIPIISSTLNQKSKIVNQYNKDTGEYIQTFSGLKVAARALKEQGVAKGEERGISSNIGAVANGKRKTAYGFIWKFT